MSIRNRWNDEGSRENLKNDHPQQTLNDNLHHKKELIERKFYHYWIIVRDWTIENKRVLVLLLFVLIPLYLMMFPFRKVVPDPSPNINPKDGSPIKMGEYWENENFGSKSQNALDKTKNFVNEKIEDMKDLKDTAKYKTKNFVNQKKKEVKNKVEDLKDTAKEKAKDVGNKAKKIFKSSGLQGKMKDAKDYIKEKTEDVKDYLKEKKDIVQDKWEDAREYINKKTGIEDKLEDAREYINKKTGIEDKLEDAKYYIKEKTNDVKDYLKEKKDIVQEKFGDAKDFIKEKRGLGDDVDQDDEFDDIDDYRNIVPPKTHI